MATIGRLLCLTGFILFLSLVSPVFAQNGSNLELSNPRFKQQQSVNFTPRLTAAKSGRDEDDYLPGEIRPQTGMQEKTITSKWTSKAKASALNTGRKTIRAIDWEYIFFADAGMQRVLGRYRIHSRTQLRSGETKTLRGDVFSPVLSPYQKVLPRRIEYTDGTVWQSP
jgi:hypothetical protein